MKHWFIKLLPNDKSLEAAIVPPVLPGVATLMTLGEQAFKIRWEPKLNAIFVGKEGQRHEKVIKFRSSECRYSPTELMAISRLSLGGMKSFSLEAHISPGGKETLFRQKALKQRGINMTAPMTGRVIKVCKTQGSSVTKGETIGIIEAMKMENNIQAQHDGTIESISIKEGDSIQVGSPVATIKPN